MSSTNRYSRLLNLLKSSGFSGVAINPGPTLTYLTGLSFHLMERPVVLLITTDEIPVLILPELETSRLDRAAIPLRAFSYSDNPETWVEAFQAALKTLKLNKPKIAVEANRFRFLELNFLKTADPEIELSAGDDIFSQLRLLKDDDEIALMHRAVAAAQQALEYTMPLIKPGVSEKDIAAELTIQLLRAGSEPELPFPPIVSGGPNSADPHATPTERKLQMGDLLVIDWGAAVGGYCSDLTRTFAIGHLDEELKGVYQTVQQANAAGRSAAKPGRIAGEIDRITRTVIETAGYGKYFTHRTGHGLGMEAHEQPYIYGENKLSLSPGMVFTIEPGIYLPQKGGVRIEDDVVITATGCESLSNFPRELVIL
jgi:Xaa-Pro dipeptidase